jgi:light-harvesting protein B-800-850 alpha chain
MNQGRIWCVVSPNVGLPLLLGSVAITSFIVHASVMTHTTWMSNYWQGAKARTAENGQPAVAAAKTDAPYVVSIAPVAGTPGKTESSFVVTVTPSAGTPSAGTPNAGAATSTASLSPVPASKPVAVAAASSD